MRMVGWNLALALAWCALAGRLTLVDLLVGYAIGYGLLGWLVPSAAAQAYVRRLPRVLAFLVVYAYQVISSSLRIAWEVVTPRPRRSPGIIAVPLDVTTPAADAELPIMEELTLNDGGTMFGATGKRCEARVGGQFMQPQRLA